MELLVKACGVCIAAAVFAALLRRSSPAFALLLGAAASCAVLAAALGLIGTVAGTLDELTELTGMSPVALGVVLKTVGIAVLSRFATELCREAGSGSAAAAVELTACAAALYTVLPLMKTVLQMIEGLL